MKISMKREQNSAGIGSAEREKFGAKLKTKNIFKALAAAMLMPAMLLTTACSNEDDAVNNTENTAKKGYELPVTVNVTRQSDATTRASYDDDTKKLSFNTGDKLFVRGVYVDDGMKWFAGTLNWVSDGTFSGTITTQSEWKGTFDELLQSAQACLLPAGYESIGYLSINDNSTVELYDDYLDDDANKAFATSKAAAVEQFSLEMTDSYASGFALSPQNAILNFTITGLTPSTEAAVVFKKGYSVTISGNVTPNGSGTATFAVGVSGYTDLNNCTLTVGGNAITLVSSSKTVTAGHIYNITRSVAPAPSYTMAAAATDADKGKLICTDGHIHAYGADASCTKARVAKIICLGSGTGYTHGLALALEDVSSNGLSWDNSSGNNNNKTAAEWCSAWNESASPKKVTDASWMLPSKPQWQTMGATDGSSTYGTLRDGFSSVGGTNMQSGNYWSSSEDDSNSAWRYSFDVGYWDLDGKGYYDIRVRACLVF